MRVLLIVLTVCLALVVAAIFAGPVSSGALLLLLPAHQRQVEHGLPADYTPLHKGHVNLNVGLYVRQNEDLIVPGTPPLVLRRTYISGFRVTKQFGIGTTHASEWYVVGDGKRFQWAALIRPGEHRVTFERTSPGALVSNAMFQHRSSPAEWQGARLGWTGLGWALRQADGTLARFRLCGPDENSVCSIVRHRDADGHVVDYRRNAAGRLERMEAGPERWIAFDYDARDRVLRAFASTGHEVRYEYDDGGRLASVESGGATTHRYTYTDRDEMATITEPGTDIENTYDADGRCIRQVNRYADGSDPYIFDNAYTLDGSDVVQTDVRRSDATWTQYRFNKMGYTTSETWGRENAAPATFDYERDPVTNAVTSLSLTCPDRTGRQLRHASLVRPGREDWIKWDLVRTHCAWPGLRWRAAE